jgi:NAD(P)H-hydrate epimerase
MNGDTGEAEGDVVKADVTVTFAAPKQGFCNKSAMPLLGHLMVSDIGIPDEIAFKHVAQSKYQLISRPELAQSYHERSWISNKGTYGHVCVIGGIDTYPNAPVLSAAGALRSGAGLVTLRSCCAASGCALSRIPEVIVNSLSLDDFFLADDEQRAMICLLDSYNVIVAGPGLGRSEGATAIIRYLIENFKGSLVLDADALNVLAEICSDGYKVRDDCSLVITPHPGEAARLLRCEVKDVQDDRIAAVKTLAQQYNAIAVLKGSGTLVSDGESLPWLNLTGNPGMATAGTGDVLAGIIGGLLAQGLEPMLAATMGVWVHGSAGDFAWMKGSQTTLTAGDVVAMLPLVYQNIER